MTPQGDAILEGHGPKAIGWEALQPTRETAALWREYIAEIRAERDELLEALGDLLAAVRAHLDTLTPQAAALVYGSIAAPIVQAELVVRHRERAGERQ